MGKIKLEEKLVKLYNRFIYFFSFEKRELRRIRRTKRFSTLKTHIFGFDFELVDSASFFHQYTEIFHKQVYLFSIEKNRSPYIIDCGANVGVSVLYFKKVFPNSQIVAFEADKKIFKVLKRNIEKSNEGGVTLLNKGLWNKEGKLNFINEGADGGRICENKIPSDGLDIVEIESIRLRDYLNVNVDFLKIDIEGAETIVLEDCKDVLNNVKNIFVEFHSEVASSQELDRILKILRDNGFRYYIESSTIINDQPFIWQNKINGFDNLLNIYAYQEK